VKDLIFPGNLQEIINKVLATGRTSRAQLVEAGTKAEVQRIEAQTRAEALCLQAHTEAKDQRLKAQADAEGQRLKITSELQAIEERAKTAAAQTAILRLEELAALRELGRNANARIYLDYPGASKESADDGR
jgi:regulator of protease activity HflC (stomatin/prohibitin superfamily)